LADGRISRPDPWQNAGTVGLHGVMAALYGQSGFDASIGPDGLAGTLTDFWGDPFAEEQTVIPPSLQQPELGLPFAPNRFWDFTGGPHPSWGDSLPWGALDLAPPSAIAGCAESPETFTAPADGVVTTSDYAMLMLDLDGDSDQRTGWVIFFYHVGLDNQAPAGMVVKMGDRRHLLRGRAATGRTSMWPAATTGRDSAGGPIPPDGRLDRRVWRRALRRDDDQGVEGRPGLRVLGRRESDRVHASLTRATGSDFGIGYR
jgi:hypothetical protein